MHCIIFSVIAMDYQEKFMIPKSSLEAVNSRKIDCAIVKRSHKDEWNTTAKAWKLRIEQQGPY
jgi:hypothetical protein